MHNPDFMLQLLVNLALHYPQAGRTPAQLQILAEDWAEDLAEFSPETVERAVKQYREDSSPVGQDGRPQAGKAGHAAR